MRSRWTLVLLAAFVVLAWAGVSLFERDAVPHPVINQENRQQQDEAADKMPAVPSGAVIAVDKSPAKPLPAVPERSTDPAPGSGPGDPVWVDEDAVGPGGLPADNIMPMPPEFGDQGTPGLAPEAYEPDIPSLPPEQNEPQAVEMIPPEGGGGG